MVSEFITRHWKKLLPFLPVAGWVGWDMMGIQAPFLGAGLLTCVAGYYIALIVLSEQFRQLLPNRARSVSVRSIIISALTICVGLGLFTWTGLNQSYAREAYNDIVSPTPTIEPAWDYKIYNTSETIVIVEVLASRGTVYEYSVGIVLTRQYDKAESYTCSPGNPPVKERLGVFVDKDLGMEPSVYTARFKQPILEGPVHLCIKFTASNAIDVQSIVMLDFSKR